jgi:hypothetical protein
MAESKTKVTGDSVPRFIGAIKDEATRRDCEALIRLMQEVSKESPQMWGPSIVGFGSYHYKYESGREGDSLRIGFSPRKNNIAIYGCGLKDLADELKRLGKHKVGGGCLYIKKLSDVDEGQLTKILSAGYRKLR